MPRTFQGRLTLAFLAVVTLTLGLVTVLVINRLDDYFTSQQTADLEQRAETVSAYVQTLADGAAAGRPVVGVGGVVDPAVLARLADPNQQQIIADRLGQADVSVRIGQFVTGGESPTSGASGGGR